MKDLLSIVHFIYIFSTVLIIFSNLLVVGVVLASSRIRSSSRHVLMGGLAVADLLMGSFVCPLYIRSALELKFHDCHLHLALQVIGDHGVFFVTGWTLVTLNVFLLRKHSWLRWPCQQICCIKVAPKVQRTALVLWPWLMGLAVLVPLLATYSVAFVVHPDEDPLCMLSLPENILVIVTFLSLYLPFYLVVAATITLIACSGRSHHNPLTETGTTTLIDSPDDPTTTTAPPTATEALENNPTDDEDIVETPTTREEGAVTEATTPVDNFMHICIPNSVYLVCYIPFVIHTWLYMGNVTTPMPVYIFTLSGLLARSYLLPVSWLIFKSVRQEVKGCWNKVVDMFCSCVRHSPTSSASSVSFSRLQETQMHDHA